MLKIRISVHIEVLTLVPFVRAQASNSSQTRFYQKMIWKSVTFFVHSIFSSCDLKQQKIESQVLQLEMLVMLNRFDFHPVLNYHYLLLLRVSQHWYSSHVLYIH